MEMNVEKMKVRRISLQPPTVQITVDQKEVENVDYFSYLDNLITMMQDVHVKLNAELPW